MQSFLSTVLHCRYSSFKVVILKTTKHSSAIGYKENEDKFIAKYPEILFNELSYLITN